MSAPAPASSVTPIIDRSDTFDTRLLDRFGGRDQSRLLDASQRATDRPANSSCSGSRRRAHPVTAQPPLEVTAAMVLDLAPEAHPAMSKRQRLLALDTAPPGATVNVHVHDALPDWEVVQLLRVHRGRLRFHLYGTDANRLRQWIGALRGDSQVEWL